MKRCAHRAIAFSAGHLFYVHSSGFPWVKWHAHHYCNATHGLNGVTIDNDNCANYIVDISSKD